MPNSMNAAPCATSSADIRGYLFLHSKWESNPLHGSTEDAEVGLSPVAVTASDSFRDQRAKPPPPTPLSLSGGKRWPVKEMRRVTL